MDGTMMKYKIYSGLGLSSKLIGYYDEEYIYDQNERCLYEYGGGKIKEISYLPNTIAYYKNGYFYNDEMFSKVLGEYSNGKVYKGMGYLNSDCVGSYEGVNGFCAAAILLLDNRISSIEETNSIHIQDNNKVDSMSGIFEGGISNILISIFGGIILLAILYAVMKTAIGFWMPNIDGLSLSNIYNYVTSENLDSDDISLAIIVITNIIFAILVTIRDKSENNGLIDKIGNSYSKIYFPSMIICQIITFVISPSIINIIPIAFSSAIVTIVPAIISGTICYLKT